ncbi:uncharacterized protein A4U43_C05F7300 [Asparagus officinalis]|uniref:Uncharacterized protein n=1 Tax=Asparagus officinalis TaxID=4686 RepID=A0A5P1EQ06_ASPOF|nr:uncharacterized protein A4U43_C05F7300 [Asparagus officinalis]
MLCFERVSFVNPSGEARHPSIPASVDAAGFERVSFVNPSGEARHPSIPAAAAIVEAPSIPLSLILSEAFVFYEAILSREYFRGEGLGLGQGQQELGLMNKHMRFLTRFLTICLVTGRRDMVNRLVGQLKGLVDECKKNFQIKYCVKIKAFEGIDEVEEGSGSYLAPRAPSTRTPIADIASHTSSSPTASICLCPHSLVVFPYSFDLSLSTLLGRLHSVVAPYNQKKEACHRLRSDKDLADRKLVVRSFARLRSVFCSLRRTEAYEKLSILNEVYEQEIVSLGIDTKAIKAEKEDDQGKEMEEVKDDSADMGIEVDEVTLT